MVQSGSGGGGTAELRGVALQTGPHAEKDLIFLRAPKGAKGNSTVLEGRPGSTSDIKRNPSCRKSPSQARKGRRAENIWTFRLQA